MNFKGVCGWAAAAGLALASNLTADRFGDYAAAGVFKAENGVLETVGEKDATIFHWSPAVGQTAVLDLRHDSPLFDRLRAVDRLDFEFNIVTGRLSEMGVSILGLASGARRYKIHDWKVAFPTTPCGKWVPVSLDMARPNWFPWDNPDGVGTDVFFRLNALALEPGTIVDIRRIQATADRLLLKPDFELPVTWPVRTERPDGGSEWTVRFELLNASGKPDTIRAEILSEHRRFKVAFVSNAIPAKASAPVVFELRAEMSTAEVRAAGPLYAEPVRVAFSLESEPGLARAWAGEWVAPLPPEVKRQVILSEPERAALRAVAADPEGALAKAIEWKKILAKADDFRGKELLEIPKSHLAPAVAVEKDWKVTGRMCEITNSVTGETEFGTEHAGSLWKAYLEMMAAENLGLAYQVTGDESYARQGIAYFRLLGRQYREVPLNKAFEKRWNGGASILIASRQSSNSSYGGNYIMKSQLHLLNLVAEAPSWTEADRALAYEGFALPYAMEIMKFKGGINNMTDIGNHNVLLMGLAFRDAGLVRWALLHEAGLIRRLADIDRDGFSSEGRPISYQMAGMAEYMPSLVYLANSGLKVEAPLDRLLEAFRMPFKRAGLNGVIPNTGDCARWILAGSNPHADYAIALFPGEAWLHAIAKGSTLTGKIRNFLSGRKADPEGWKLLLEKEPHLFAEAGLAVLRTGDTAGTQIMATLDYGRNVFHSHLDRLQVTLMAYGLVFTHGPGSLYNAGFGGMTNGPERLKGLISGESLAQNVILADGKSQNPAVGRLLAWKAGPELQAAVARVDGLWPGVSHTRGLVLTEGVVVMFDRMEALEPHTFDFIYHNFGRQSPGPGWTATPQAGPLGTSVMYERLAEVCRLAGSGPVRLTWDLSEQVAKPGKGEAKPEPVHLDLWQIGPEDGEAYTALTALNNPNNKTIYDEAPALIRRAKGRTASFVTVLAPRREAQGVQSVEPEGKEGVKIILSGGRTLRLSLEDLLK